MKFGVLRSIGHNIADSLAEGNGFLIGVYNMNVWDAARRSAQGFIEVDFLTGASSGGLPSPSLARAFVLYSEALPSLCARQGIPVAAFRRLHARFFHDRLAMCFTVTVEDRDGQRVTDEYVGSPGRRLKILDQLGRIRRKRSRVARTFHEE
jgi:hypothetical protein